MQVARTLAILTAEGKAVTVTEERDGRVHFIADADIDADGAPRAYNAHNTGLDHISNAKTRDGRFVGVLTDAAGKPLVQGPNDPAPGYYISPTTYEHRDQPRNTQRRYIDASKVPFIVVPPEIRAGVRGIVIGCRARATNLRNGRYIEGLVADIGPRNKAGELSIEAAMRLAIAPSPRFGGTDAQIIQYELWPGTPAIVDGVTYRLQPA